MSLRFRRHYKLIVALTLLASLLVLGAGEQRISAYTVTNDQQALRQAVTYGQHVAVLFASVVDYIPILISHTGAGA